MLVLRRRRGQKGERARDKEIERESESEVARIQCEDTRGESAQSASGAAEEERDRPG